MNGYSCELNFDEYICANDFFNDLNELKLNSVLELDSSPSEILAEANVISPIDSFFSPQTSHDTSSSDEDSKVYAYQSSYFGSQTSKKHLDLSSIDTIDCIEDLLNTNGESKPNLQKGPVLLIENEEIKRNGTFKGHYEHNNNCENGTINDTNIESSIIYNKETIHIIKDNLKHGLKNVKLPIRPLIKQNITNTVHKNLKQNRSQANLLPNVSSEYIPIKKTNNGTTMNSSIVIVAPQCYNIEKSSMQQQDKVQVQNKRVHTKEIELDLALLSRLPDQDVQAIKRQQRIIKNRESACLSSKKKRDYVTSLEKQLSEAYREIGRLQVENTMLREQLDTYNKLPRKIPQRVSSTMIPRKNIAVLFAMIFMISLNIGGFNVSPWRYRNTNKQQISQDHLAQRHLLWNIDDSNIEGEIQDGEKIFNSSSDCNNITLDVNKSYFNESESVRLATELKKWIGLNGRKFNSTLENHDGPVNFDVEITEDVLKSYSMLDKLIFPKKILNTFAQFNLDSAAETKTKHIRTHKDNNLNQFFDFETLYPNRIKKKGFNVDINDADPTSDWDFLLKALDRKDDTFYVVGVGKGGHLMLPAVAHNTTRPPKMALILPAKNDTVPYGDVVLMQIDCSVVNTTIVKLSADTPIDISAKTKNSISERPMTKEYYLRERRMARRNRHMGNLQNTSEFNIKNRNNK